MTVVAHSTPPATAKRIGRPDPFDAAEADRRDIARALLGTGAVLAFAGVLMTVITWCVAVQVAMRHPAGLAAVPIAAAVPAVAMPAVLLAFGGRLMRASERWWKPIGAAADDDETDWVGKLPLK